MRFPHTCSVPGCQTVANSFVEGRYLFGAVIENKPSGRQLKRLKSKCKPCAAVYSKRYWKMTRKTKIKKKVKKQNPDLTKKKVQELGLNKTSFNISNG